MKDRRLEDWLIGSKTVSFGQIFYRLRSKSGMTFLSLLTFKGFADFKL